MDVCVCRYTHIYKGVHDLVCEHGMEPEDSLKCHSAVVVHLFIETVSPFLSMFRDGDSHWLETDCD